MKLKHLFYFIFYLCVTSNQLYILDYIIGGTSRLYLCLFIFLILFIFYFKKNNISRNVQKYYILLLIMFFLLHVLFFSKDLRPLYYIILLLLLLIKIPTDIVLNFTIYFIKTNTLLILFLILQFILIFIFYDGNIFLHDTFTNFEIDGRQKEIYSIPYNLGFVSSGSDTSITLFNKTFFRSLSYSLEPKFIASLFLVSFTLLIFLKKHFKFYNFYYFCHIISFILIFSGSLFLILFISYLIKIILKKISSLLLIISIAIIFLILPIIGTSLAIYLNDFWLHRLLGALMQFNFISNIQLNLTMFGNGINYTNNIDTSYSINILTLYLQYGFIGVLLLLKLFSILTNNVTNYYNSVNVTEMKNLKFATILIIFTNFTYNFLFLHDTLTPLAVFTIIFTNNLINFEKNQTYT